MTDWVPTSYYSDGNRLKLYATEYNTSLIHEPFLFDETRILAKILLSSRRDFATELKILEQRNLNENLIGCKSRKQLKQINPALFQRLGAMGPYLSDAVACNDDDSDAKWFVLYAICWTNKLVRDFFCGTYFDNYNDISDSIDRYIESVCKTNAQMSHCDEQTKVQLKQALAQILVDADIIVKQSGKFMPMIFPTVQWSGADPIYAALTSDEEEMLDKKFIKRFR